MKSLVAAMAIVVASVLLAYETWSVLVTCGESCRDSSSRETWLRHDHAWQWYADYAVGVAAWLSTIAAAWCARYGRGSFVGFLLLSSLLFTTAYAWPILASGN
jgi:hypothetical protein